MFLLFRSNTSDFIPTTCRNSLQGKVIIVDDKGKIERSNAETTKILPF